METQIIRNLIQTGQSLKLPKFLPFKVERILNDEL